MRRQSRFASIHPRMMSTLRPTELPGSCSRLAIYSWLPSNGWFRCLLPHAWLPRSVGAVSLITVPRVWQALIGRKDPPVLDGRRAALTAGHSRFNPELLIPRRDRGTLAPYTQEHVSGLQQRATPMTVRVAGLGSVIQSDMDGKLAASSLSFVIVLAVIYGIVVSVLLAVAIRKVRTVSRVVRIEERARFELALNSETDGIWQWDIRTGVVVRSAQFWTRLGYTTGDRFRSADDWLSIVHPDDRARVKDALDAHITGSCDAYLAQYRVRSVSGQWHTFVDRGRIVSRTGNGAPLHLLGTFADVTDRRNAEESLRQAEMTGTMARLAARIAHEINNPLAGIRNSFLLIMDAVPPTHPHFKYVGAIEREVERISQVTRQLYETYRVEAEPSRHAPVQSVVSDAVMFMEQVNRNTGVSVVAELDDTTAFVRLSDSMLRQCLCKLIQCAIEASASGSRVVVQGQTDRDHYVVRVIDSGPGVPAALRDRIFDSLVSTTATHPSIGGMGLGLSQVRRAVEAAGGSVYVTDAADGGAEFVVRLPLADTSTMGVTG